MLDVIREVREFNAGRDPERLALKFRNMRSDPFVFLRATAHLFYRRLPELPDSPAVWCCGDLHLQNFGSYKGDNRQVYFDLNDFDEGVLAPAHWELVRFLTSVHAGAASLGVKRKEAAALNGVFLDAYRERLVSGKALWVERETATGLVHQLLDGLRRRERAAFLDGRTRRKGKQRRLRLDNGKALPVSDKQRERVERFMAGVARTREDPAFYEVLDVARRIAGNGSLGVDRFVILVRGKGSPDGNYLLDLKEALPSALLPVLTTPQPAWKNEAARVVAVQRRMQAVSMAFLLPERLGKRAYLLRELQPTEDRVTLDAARSGLPALREVLATMGHIVASAQLRSSGRDGSANADALIDFGAARWRKALLAAAEACAGQLRADWQTFCAAYDDGVFTP